MFVKKILLTIGLLGGTTGALGRRICRRFFADRGRHGRWPGAARFTAVAGGDPSAFLLESCRFVAAETGERAISSMSPCFGDLAQYNTASAVLNLNDQFAVGLSWIRLGIDEIPRYG
jgi:hypothetical protein